MLYVQVSVLPSENTLITLFMPQIKPNLNNLLQHKWEKVKNKKIKNLWIYV